MLNVYTILFVGKKFVRNLIRKIFSARNASSNHKRFQSLYRFWFIKMTNVWIHVVHHVDQNRMIKESRNSIYPESSILVSSNWQNLMRLTENITPKYDATSFLGIHQRNKVSKGKKNAEII